jgi:hypothetical protein
MVARPTKRFIRNLLADESESCLSVFVSVGGDADQPLRMIEAALPSVHGACRDR